MTQPLPEVEPEETPPSLAELAVRANTQLEEAAKQTSDQAFNMGCSIIFVPALVLVGLVFIFTGANWVAAMITAILATVIALVLSLAAANRARINTLRRRYEEQVRPEIEKILVQTGHSPQKFAQAADQALPSEAVLRRFLDIPQESPLESPADVESQENL